jgi:predicted ATPase/class 3 adenylate cyclase
MDVGRLDPYIPRLAAEWEQTSPGANWRELDATCCFVDISGFTALSERLARRGRIGAEELTGVLDHVFSRMLGVAYDKGGSLLKFGGDALLLAFTSGDHPALATEAAVAMRAALRDARHLPTSVGRLNLRMSVGLHSGTFQFFRAGTSHRELIVAGPSASETTRMEQIADAGEIVVSAALAERLPARAVGAPKGDGRLLRSRTVVEGGPGAPPARQVPAGDVERSIPIALRAHLRDGSGESEHRLATVAFVKFRGVDDLIAERGVAVTADALDAIVTAVQGAADAEAVTFLASDIDANGGKIILVAGVPVARDDDEGRVLRAARAIQAAQLPLPVCIGVNRGHVFAGDIGTEFRRTFTVMGDTVNLAARLMAAAKPGSVYATGEVLERARTHFTTAALEPFFVKGKAEPVHAFEVGPAQGVKTVGYGSLPFAGRSKEIATIRDAYRSAAEGRSSVVMLEAERGAGKTRLLDEALAPATGTTLRLQGEAYGVASPYLPLRDPLRDLLGVTDPDRARAGAEAVAAIAARTPSRLPLAPLLAPVLDVDIDPTPESASIAAEFVRDRLADLLVDVLTSVEDAPLVIVAEDAHWFDDATSRVMERLAAASAPWLLCVTRRPVAAGFRPAAPDIALHLDPLDEAISQELVDSATRDRPLRPQQRARIVSRGAGNPLFLEELVRVARDTDTESLPESLDAVAMREIDALPPRARRILRIGSVLGRSFEHELLTTILASDELELDVMTRAQLEPYLLPDGDDRLQFRHALLQEAAYNSLPFRTRLALHRRVGEAIERRVRDTDEAASLLALHFSEAQDWERSWRFAGRAAELAQRAGAPGETVAHLERTLTAARRLEMPVETVGTIYEQLGEALLTLGIYDEADNAYRRAMLARSDDPLSRARIAERRSYVRGEHQGRLTSAVRQARAGLALLSTIPAGGPEVAAARARLLGREADLRYRQGRLQEAAELCRRAIAEAEAAGEQRALAVALSVLDSCLVEMGRPEEATNMTRVLELYEQLGDLMYVAITLGNLGGVSFFESKWDEADDYYRRAAAAAVKAGDLATAAIADTNLGELRVNQGRLAEAEALLVPAVRTLESFEYLSAAAAAMLQLGRVLAFTERTEQGMTTLRTAATIFDDAHSLFGSLEARARLAEIATHAGDLDTAANALAEARDLERTLGETPLSALLDRIEITREFAAGATARAIELLAPAIARAERLGAAYDLFVMLGLSETLGLDPYADLRAELTRQLGIVRLAAIPS